MSRRPVGLLLLGTALLAGCGGSPEIAQRFDAEKALWTVNREFARLAIRPQLVEEAQWRGLLDRYVAIGDRFAAAPAAAGTDTESGRAAADIRAIASQALSRAASLAVELGDTTRAEELYGRINETFPEFPVSVAGASLALGQLKEAHGDRAGAVEDYRHALAAWSDSLGGRSLDGAILQLPLRIARIRAAGGEDPVAAYAPARAYYEGVLDRRHDGSAILEARSRLIDVATDLRDWSTAREQMELLEAALREMPDPPEDPARVRFGIADIERMALGDPARAAKTLESILADYPKSPQAARALLALAQYSYGPTGDVQAALAWLDRLDKEYPNEDATVADGRLYRAQILERTGKWADALELYRSLPVDHPLSEAAMQAPLLIVRHYHAAGDSTARRRALDDAEQQYLGFLDRYPSESVAASARGKLAEVYWAAGRYREAVEQLELLGEMLRGTERGAAALLAAAEGSRTQLADTTRARELFERAASWYPGTEVGRRAAEAAGMLGGGEPR